MKPEETYEMLLDLLEAGAARYRLIGHEPQSVIALASHARGHAPQQAANCVVARVQLDEKATQFVLAVVPGHRLVALETLREMWGGTSVSFATRETAEALSGCVSDTIIPFSFHPGLSIVVDADLLAQREIYFNAARLDESIALATADYVRLARPMVAQIAQPAVLAQAG